MLRAVAVTAAVAAVAFVKVIERTQRLANKADTNAAVGEYDFCAGMDADVMVGFMLVFVLSLTFCIMVGVLSFP